MASRAALFTHGGFGSRVVTGIIGITRSVVDCCPLGEIQDNGQSSQCPFVMRPTYLLSLLLKRQVLWTCRLSQTNHRYGSSCYPSITPYHTYIAIVPSRICSGVHTSPSSDDLPWRVPHRKPLNTASTQTRLQQQLRGPSPSVHRRLRLMSMLLLMLLSAD
jgi:hypothetical protein